MRRREHVAPDRPLVPDYVLKKAKRDEQELIDPAFERSLGLMPWLARGRMQDAMAWLHTSPEDEAKRKAALEARKNHSAASAVPEPQPPKEEP